MDSHMQIKSQFYALLNNSPDGIWISDKEGMVLRVNRAAQENSAFKQEDVIGKSISQILKEEHIKTSATAKALETQKQQSVLEYKEKTGRTLLITATPIFNQDGELEFIIANERDISQLNKIREELEQSRLEAEKVKEELTEQYLRELGREEIIAESKEMKHVLLSGLKLARVGVSNILITGGSGTGKGLLAGYIHKKSNRRHKPFVHINCAAIPEGLIEAELFGYEKGAFTGASQKGKAGLFELSHKGTLFLDEIGDLPIHMQAKLLTYLDNHKVMRIGGTKPLHVECSILAATNLDLKAAVKKKKFREDLYYRLSSFAINIPPLRQRPEDITKLIQHFLVKYNKEFKQQKKITKQALDVILVYPFPGNVRELKDMVKRAVILSRDDVIDNLLPNTTNIDDLRNIGVQVKDERIFDLKKALLATEKKAFAQAIKHCRSTREIADFLHISQTKVVRGLRKHGLSL